MTHDPIAPRFVWLDRELPVGPGDRVLEVGCGHGIGVALVGARLTTGHLLAIDRSATMTAVARRRNAGLMDLGRVAIRTAALTDLPLDSGPFDLVFAMNVSAFARQDSPECAHLSAILGRNGRAYLFHDGPGLPQAQAFRAGASRALRACGFDVRDGRGEGAGVLLVATRPG